MSQQKHITFFLLMLLMSVYSALAQSPALSPLEGSIHTYAWDGVSEGSRYTFYVTTQVEGQAGDYVFIGDNSGVVGIDRIASAQIQWNSGSSINQYKVWLEVSISGCSNAVFVEVSPQPNNRTIGFDVAAGTDCFNLSGNDFAISFITLDNNGQPVAAAHFPLLVECSVNGKSFTQTVNFDNQELQIEEDMFSANSESSAIIEVVIINVTDVRNAPINPDVSKGTHIRTIHPVPVIEFALK